MNDYNLHEEMETLKADVAKLRADVSDLLDVLREIGAEKVESTKSSIEDEIRERRERLREAINRAEERGRRTSEDFERNIAQHPLSSVLAAFGLGFILAKLGHSHHGGRAEPPR